MEENFYNQSQSKAMYSADALIKTLPRFCSSFFLHLRADNYSALTILNYAYDLDHFFKYLVSQNPSIKSINDIQPEILDQLVYDDMEEYKAYSAKHFDESGNLETLSSATIQRKLSTLRAFFGFCISRNIMRHNPLQGITNPKNPDKGIIYLEPDEITSLLKEIREQNHLTKHQKHFCKRTLLRDYAIILTLLSTGLRVSELVGLNTANIDFKNQAFYVHRKGNKEQYVYFSESVKDILKEYMETERAALRPDTDALFLSNKGERLCVRSVQRIVGKYSQSTDVTMKHITPHKLRSTFGTNYYRETGDIYLTADAMNHSSVATTAKHYSAQSDANRKRVKDIQFIQE